MTEYTPTHCPYCGESLETRHVEGRDRLYCTDCERTIYQNPDPTASLAVVDEGLVLLVKRLVEPDRGKWGLPAGFIEIDEEPPEAAVRELHEETGLETDPSNLQIVDTVTTRHETGRTTVSIGYAVSVEATNGSIREGKEASKVKFWDPEELAASSNEQLRAHDHERVRKAIAIISED